MHKPTLSADFSTVREALNAFRNAAVFEKYPSSIPEDATAALRRLEEQLQDYERADQAWQRNFDLVTEQKKRILEQLDAAQSWYLDHITEDGIYDAQTWGDPFVVANPAISQNCSCGHASGLHRPVKLPLGDYSTACQVALCACRDWDGPEIVDSAPAKEPS